MPRARRAAAVVRACPVRSPLSTLSTGHYPRAAGHAVNSPPSRTPFARTPSAHTLPAHTLPAHSLAARGACARHWYQTTPAPLVPDDTHWYRTSPPHCTLYLPERRQQGPRVLAVRPRLQPRASHQPRSLARRARPRHTARALAPAVVAATRKSFFFRAAAGGHVLWAAAVAAACSSRNGRRAAETAAAAAAVRLRVCFPAKQCRHRTRSQPTDTPHGGGCFGKRSNPKITTGVFGILASRALEARSASLLTLGQPVAAGNFDNNFRYFRCQKSIETFIVGPKRVKI
jgi:hypothetical protein